MSGMRARQYSIRRNVSAVQADLPLFPPWPSHQEYIADCRYHWISCERLPHRKFRRVRDDQADPLLIMVRSVIVKEKVDRKRDTSWARMFIDKVECGAPLSTTR
jgi:hypothetical protein